MGRALILTLASYLAAHAQVSPAEQTALIEKAKAVGASYSKQLQRFSASQVKTRTTAFANVRKAKWSPLETTESDLDFDAGKLTSTLRRVRGEGKQPWGEKMPLDRVKPGYLEASGEFEAIDWIFTPARNATLTWDHAEPGGACVLHYQVSQQNSRLTMSAGTAAAQLGHQGSVFVDCASGNILRVQMKSDPAKLKLNKKDAAVGMELDVHYAATEISGQEYWLPSQAVLVGQFNNTLTKAELSFSRYRKYEASSSIVFETQ